MKIVFYGRNAANFREGFEALIGPGHEVVTLSDALDGPGEAAHFESAEVIVGNKLGAEEPNPRALKLYQAPAAGTDAINPARLPPGATLCNAFGHEQPIAEYVMAALLMRHVPIAAADAALRKGQWDYWAGRPGALRTELGDQTIGLLGFGHIGKAIAGRAKAFGCRVVVANRTVVPVGSDVDESYGLDQLSAFMGAADAIIVSLPLMEATRGIVDAAALGAMRPHGVIVNVGRGPVIDEKALFEALSTRRIGGAIIDTWYQYPTAEKPDILPGTFPFETLSNVVLTPHMSGWTHGTVRRRQETVAENIRRLTMGEALLNRVAGGGKA
jgi:phosphoglycerate dehydrogenase-like enzyme